jgi:hypothetical protein
MATMRSTSSVKDLLTRGDEHVQVIDFKGAHYPREVILYAVFFT